MTQVSRWGKDSLLNKCVWNNIDINLKKKKKTGFCLLTNTEINLKQIIQLTVKSETVKILEESRTKHFHSFGIDFLNWNPKSMKHKRKHDNLCSIKLFFLWDTVKNWKDKPQAWKNYLWYICFTKDLDPVYTGY